MGDEFFIGWQGRMPEKLGRFLKRLVVGMLVITGLVVAGVSAVQRTVAKGATWDYTEVEFVGILVKEPMPVLVGDDGEVRFLVNPLKFGFDEGVAEEFHLRRVSLRGTLISRDGTEMIEGLPETVKALGEVGANPLNLQDFGEVVSRGEIVDSKCYLGVMNPGNLKPHRACAINCIAGGIPPVLVVRDESGRAEYVLLVGEKGEAINERVLPLVAEPVEVRGRLSQVGSLDVVSVGVEGIRLVE